MFRLGFGPYTGLGTRPSSWIRLDVLFLDQVVANARDQTRELDLVLA